MKTLALHPTLVACAALLVSGCATAPGQPGLGDKFKQTFASDDPCSNNARNIGIIGGAVSGAVIANAMGNGGSQSNLIGAVLGGMVGGLVGADMDRKRCELSKVAKQYDLDITFANIEVQGEVKEVMGGGLMESTNKSNAKGATTVIGNSVTVRDKSGVAGHFESGSDQLTPKAKEYFSAIATQYAPETIAGTQLDPKQKTEALNQLSKRHILLVGHTDDMGSTQVNASLSERRARAVAAFLKQKGIPDESIFYQGAGESLPVADNRTEEGRATNRRVEIVELADEASFKKYLEARKPQYAFYRAQPGVVRSSPARVVVATAPTISKKKEFNVGNSAPPSVPSRKSVVKSSAPIATQVVALPKVKTKPIIDFGGVPYTSNIAKIDTGAMLQEGGFSLISTAQADDSVLVADCSYDRPRAVGAVKSLRDGRSYKTSEHLPQLYGKTWATNMNGNLVVLNHVTVLRDGGSPANLPELKVYAQYKPGSNVKPVVNEEPAVNSYLVDKGVLYRIFPKGKGGLKCIDVLFGTDGATTAKAGKLIYASTSSFVADFKPQIQ